MKKILHLSTDFQYQDLYPRLVKSLSKIGYKQQVYIQKKELEKYTKLNDVQNLDIVESNVLETWMKVFFSARVKSVYSDLKLRLKLDEVDIILAYFLFTDGFVAYKNYIENGTDYVVFIRNTDINHYAKYRPWLINRCKEVLSNSKYIVFLSYSYIQKLRLIVGEKFFDTELAQKVKVIGNIINDDWFDKTGKKNLNAQSVKILYAGEFSKNKRVKELINAFNEFSKNQFSTLTLVGNYGDDVHNIKKLAKTNSAIKVLDKISDVSKLIALFDEHHIFVMPSKTETFGNSYIEAMSRGLPVIYTSGEGIDGYFEEGSVGFSVNEPLVENINIALTKIIESYDVLSENAQLSSTLFRKENIVKSYAELIG